MSDFKIPEPNAQSMPTADISLVEDEKGVTQTESYPVIPKKNDSGDFVRPVKMSDLKRIDAEMISLKAGKIQWDELATAVAMLGFGASISALMSDVLIDSTLGVIFYVATPIVSFSAVMFVVMYKIMKKKTGLTAAEAIAEIVKNYIDDDRKEEKNNEPE